MKNRGDLPFQWRWCSVALVVVMLMWSPGCGRKTSANPPPHKKFDHPPKLVVPANGAYTGAYMEFGEREDNVSLEAIEEFEEQVGKHQAIVAFSSYWGEQHFPAEAARLVAAHGSIPLLFWSPWDWPYREDLVEVHGPDKYRLDNILAGQWDAYIDAWADDAKTLGTPLLVSLCNEANGYWFPWSATYYGGEKRLADSNPPRYAGPEFFKRVYRYVVDRVRARGATNVLWVLHLNNFSDPYAPWNAMEQYYPGDDYVDWLGLSVYGQLFPDDPKWEEFENMAETPYEEICKLSPTKPVMFAEWGVGEFPEKGSKADWISEGFEQMRTRFPRLHAAVYWHERWQNNKSMLYSNLKVNSSPAALEAYRRGIGTPYWLGNPVFR